MRTHIKGQMLGSLWNLGAGYLQTQIQPSTVLITGSTPETGHFVSH